MVQPNHPTTEWTSLQDIFYRRTELYALNWGIENLADYVVAASSNGGLIALIRDPTRLVSLGKASLLKPKILVYTAAGQLIESIPWDHSLRIIALGFNALEQLVVVLEEGNVRLYTLLSPCPATVDSAASTSASRNRPVPVEATSSSFYTQHSLGTEATETGVVDARIWAGGLVAYVGARRFVEWRFPGLDADAESNEFAGAVSLSGGGDYGYALPSLDDDTVQSSPPELLPPHDASSSHSADSSPSSWALIPPNVSQSGRTTVLIAQGPTLLSLTRSTAGPSSIDTACQDMRLSRGPFHVIRPSPNGKLLALMTADLVLWVVSSDFSRSLSEFDIRASQAYQDATSIDDPFRSVNQDYTSFDPSAMSKGGLGGSGVREVQWCGNNTIALAFNDEVVMVGPFGDSIRYPYSGPTHLVSEVDGVRIIASDRHEFLQKVSDVSNRVFRPGSNDPAALLFEAAEQFSAKSSRADEGIRAIRGSLPDAVDCCLRAAAYEWDLTWQKRLLKAASFGKSFIELYEPTAFVEMARTLRVLNAARNYQIGIPISYEQYVAAGPTALLSRLTAQNHHFLSLKIARYLHIRPDPILKHWARAKIARTNPALGGSTSAISAAEERLCADIVHKFRIATTLNERMGELGGSDDDKFAAGAVGGETEDATSTKRGGSTSADRGASASFAEVAWTAWRAGRGNLATRLLDHEARAIDQVPLLLNMREDKLALVKAIESGDTDLIYHVLLRLKNQLSRGDFFRIVQAPVSDAMVPSASNDRTRSDSKVASTRQYLSLASNLLEAYAKEVDRDLLKDFYYQDDRRTDSAILALQEANAIQSVTESEMPDKVFKLKTAMKFFSEDKERVLEAKLVDEQIRLLAFQQALEKEDGHRSQFTNLSLNETIRQLLFRSMNKKAEKLRSDFKVPDKRFWNIKLDTLAQSKDWDGLWAFANSKRSPIGYTPFIVKLVEQNHVQESMRFVPKIQDKADRNAFNAYLARLPSQAVANQLMDRFNE